MRRHAAFTSANPDVNARQMWAPLPLAVHNTARAESPHHGSGYAHTKGHRNGRQKLAALLPSKRFVDETNEHIISVRTSVARPPSLFP